MEKPVNIPAPLAARRIGADGDVRPQPRGDAGRAYGAIRWRSRAGASPAEKNPAVRVANARTAIRHW